MTSHLIVPVDGSPESWRAFAVATGLARKCDASVTVVQVEFDPVDGREAQTQIDAEVAQRDHAGVEVRTSVRLSITSVAEELETMLDETPDGLFVMASHGKGRSAAIVGSVAEDLLHRSFGPMVLVGPAAQPNDFTGRLLLTVDGSDASEKALPLGAAWAIDLGVTPWIIHVSEPTSRATDAVGGADVFDTVYPARLASDLRQQSGHRTEFDELHDKHPITAVCEYAEREGTSMIVTTSHGRSGLSRLALGSVAAGFVRHAPCPVMVVRLPHTA